jgi:hypothetical protein
MEKSASRSNFGRTRMLPSCLKSLLLAAGALLEAGEISKEDYDKWRYHYPKFDKTQNYVKMPPQDLV